MHAYIYEMNIIVYLTYWMMYVHEHICLHQCPGYIAHDTTCFVCWFNVKVKRNFDSIWYNYMISWIMRYFRQIVSYVLPWDLILCKHLFIIQFNDDILYPVIEATKFLKSPPKYSHPGKFQEGLLSLWSGWNGFCNSLVSWSPSLLNLHHR